MCDRLKFVKWCQENNKSPQAEVNFEVVSRNGRTDIYLHIYIYIYIYNYIYIYDAALYIVR